MSAFPRSWSRLGLLLVSGFAVACSTGVPASNPFDPDAPEELQKKARLEGFVRFDSGFPAAGIEVIASEAGSQGAAAVSTTATTNDQGGFAFEIKAGTYNIGVEAQGYVPVFVNNVQLIPGETRNVGTLTLVTGRGAIKGSVLALAGTEEDADVESAVGAVISLIPLDIPGAQTVTRVVDANGEYYADGLAAGHYVVRAEKDDFAPAYTSSSLPLVGAQMMSPAVEVELNQQTAAPELRLYPASAILKVTDANGDRVRFTKSRNVTIELYAFVQFLTQMRVAESPEELAATEYEVYSSTRAWTLTDVDGTHTLYAQFRDAFDVESETFTTTVVLDRAPPEVTTLTLNGGAQFLTNDDGTVAVHVTGQDLLSGVGGLRFTAAAAFGAEAFDPVDSVGAVYTRAFTYPLGDADGEKSLRLQLRDRAGNESEIAVATIYRDKTPPAPGVPVLEIVAPLNAGGASVRDLDVTLELNVAPDREGEPLYMAVANASGLSASSIFVPYTSPITHTLAPGPDDLSRTVYAIFKDAAGNLTEEYSLPVVVDRSGGLSGTVHAEGVGAVSGVRVDIENVLEPGVVTTVFTDGGGLWQASGLAEGAGYSITYSKAGYLDAFDLDVDVLAGATLNRGVVVLAIPRATITGSVTLVGKGDGQHAGIAISDASSTFTAVTGPNGNFQISGVPTTTGGGAATYFFSARYPGYLVFNYPPLVLTAADAGTTIPIGGQPLQTQEGDFSICDKDDTAATCVAIAFTAEARVRLDIGGTATWWRYGFTSDLSALPFDPFVADDLHLIDLPATPDGQKTVYVEFSDDGTSANGPAKVGVVTLDTTPPVPAATAVVIDPDEDGVGAIYNNHPAGQVELALSANDALSGIASVRIANVAPAGTPNFGAVTPRPYATLMTHNLDIGAQGERLVYLQFCDAVGNCTASTASAPYDAIIYDTVAPSSSTGATITINDNAVVTSSPLVAVKVTAGDAVNVRLGASQSLAGVTPVDIEPGSTVQFQYLLSLGDGTKTVYARFTDAAGNQSPVSPTNPHFDTINLDTTPPEMPLIVPVGEYTSDSTPALTWGAVADAVSYRVQLSDVSTFDGSGSVDVVQVVTSASFVPTSALADRRYFWRVLATDNAGQTSPYSPIDAFTVDTVAPAAPELQLPTSPTRQPRPPLAWSSVGDAVGYQLELDIATSFATASLIQTATTAISYAPPALADGTWYARVRSVDGAGNTSSWSSNVSVLIDTSAPANPQLVAPAAGAAFASSSVDLDWDPVTGASLYIVQWSLDATMATYEEARLSATQRTLTLGDGTWTFRVGAADAAGNTSDIAAATKRAFTIDTQAPNTPSLTLQPTWVNTRTPTFQWSNESASGATSYVLRVDGASYTVTATSNAPTASLADGLHSWTVAAVDAAGNTSAFASPQAFNVDATAPVAPTLTPVAPDPTAQARPTLSFSGVAGATSYRLDLDTAATFTTAGLQTQTLTATQTQPAANLADGTWYWRVFATDAANNTSPASATGSFVVDRTAPVDGVLTSPTSGQQVRTSSVGFTWGTVAGAATYRLEVATAATFVSPITESGLTSTTRSVVLGDGTFYARVIAIDAAGNPSPGTTSLSFTVDTTAPNTPLPALVASPNSDNTPTLSWSSSAASGAVSYSLSIDGVISPVTGVSFTPSTALADGPHSFAVAAVDAAGNTSAYSTPVAFEIDATAPPAPSITAVTPDPLASTAVTLTWGAVPGVASYTLQRDTTSAFNSASLSSQTLSTTQASVTGLTETTWYWRVRATDAAGNNGAFSTADSFTVDVTPPSDVSLSAPADNAFATSAAVTLSWTATAGASSYLVDVSTSATLATYERSAVSGTSRSVTLADGSWYWRVLAVDAAGNPSASGTATIRRVNVDTVAPAVPVLTTLATPNSDTTPTLSWGSVTGAASYIVTVDGVTSTTASTGFTTAALSDGSHTWTVASRDTAGNTSASAPAQSFVIDSTPPAVPALTAYTPDPTVDNTPAVSWSAVATATSYLVEWDNLPTYTSVNYGSATTSSTSHVIGPLANDTWYWRVRAIDSVGNASAPASPDSFIVDTSAPSAPSPTSPANASTQTSPSVTFGWSSVADAVAYRLQLSADSGFATVLFDIDGLTGTSQMLTLDDATYYWRVLAVDAADNQTPASSAVVWEVRVDANAPAAPTVAAVVTPSADSTPTFTWSDESASGAVSYDVLVDSTTTNVATTNHTPSSPLAEGSHTVRVRARDNANNVSPYSTQQTFMVDTGAPTAPSSLVPAAAGVSTTATVAFSWAASTDSLTAVSYRFEIARATDFATLTVAQDLSVTSTSVALTDGVYYWRVRALDAAGNPSTWGGTANGRQLTVDTTAPSVPVLTAVGSLVDASPTLRWSNESASGAATYTVQVDDDSAFASPNVSATVASTSQGTSLADGTWYWRVRATDANGNASAYSASDTFVLDSTPPGPPTAPLPAAGFATKALPVAFSWTAPTGGAASYLLEIAYDAAFTSLSQTVSTTATSASLSFPDGTYYWRVFSRDTAGNRSSTAAGGTSFVVDTTAPARPTAVSGPTWLGSANATYGLSWTDESDTGAATYEYQVASNSTFATIVASASVATTSVSGLTRPTTDGTYYWRVRAIDTLVNRSNWSLTASFGVDTLQPGTFSLSVPSDTAMRNDPVLALQWGASTDANGVTYRLQVGQEATFTNQIVVDTTTSTTTSYQSLAEGLYYWRVTASDPAGNTRVTTTRSFTLDRTAPAATSFLPYPSLTNDPRPNLAWAPVSGASTITVLIDDTNDFSSPVQSIALAASATSLLDASYTANLPNTTYYARLSSTDAAGNTSSPSAVIAFTVDTVAPADVSTCQLAPYATYSNAVSDSTPTFTWSPVADASEFEMAVMWWDGAAFQLQSTITDIAPNGAFNVSFTIPSTLALTDAELYRIRVRAVDAAGNASGFTVCSTNGAGATAVRSDQTAPAAGVTGLSLTPASPTNGTSVTATWNRQQDVLNSGEAGYVVRVLAADAVTVLSTQTIAWSTPYSVGTRSAAFNSLWSGTFYLEVRPFDAAQNLGPAVTSAAYVVDRDAPRTPLTYDPIRTLGVASAKRIGTNQPTFTWSDESSSGATSYTLYVYASNSSGGQGALIWSQAGVAGTSHAATAGQALVDGYYLWGVSARDAAGNVSNIGVRGPASELAHIEVDDAAPLQVTTAYGPLNGSSWRNTTLYFEFLPSATVTGTRIYNLEVYDYPGNSLVWSRSCQLASGTSCFLQVSGRGRINPAGFALPEGNYTWRIQVVDDVGNTSAWYSPFTAGQYFNVDDTPAGSPTLVQPAHLGYAGVSGGVQTCNVSFGWNEESSSGAASYNLFVQKWSGSSWSTVSGFSPRSIAGGATQAFVGTMPGTAGPAGTCKGRYRWWLQSVDTAGNVSPNSSVWEFLLDHDLPSAPTLTTASAGNKSTHVFWSKANDSATNSTGIAAYRLYYGQSTNPSTYVSGDVAAPDLDYVISGLTNRRVYYFAVAAIDGAGNVGPRSNELSRAVGWERHTVATSEVASLIPFGIQEADGVIHVGYLEHQVVWGSVASTLRMAVSQDGGQSWVRHAIDETLVNGRDTAGMYVGPAGIVVVSVDQNTDVVSWRSSDGGYSWTTTMIDGNAPVPSSGFSVTRQGGVLAALYRRASDNFMYVARSYEAGATWKTPIATYSAVTSPEFIGICNTQFKFGWFNLYNGAMNLFYSNDLGYSTTLDSDPGSVTGVGRAAIDCSDPVAIASSGKAYVVYTSTGGALYLRENDYSASYWDGATPGATTLRSSGVEPLQRPAVYAGGTWNSEKLFVAYRSTSTGRVVVGESIDPDDAIDYTWSDADLSGTAGLYLVMNGTGLGSPILAYTEETGGTLYVLRSALPSTEPGVSVTEGAATLSWWPISGAESYEISGGAATVTTPDTYYSATSGDYTYQLQGVDAQGQTGEPGLLWRMTPFLGPNSVVTGSANTTMTSLTGGMYASGSTLLTMVPLGFSQSTVGTCDSSDVCVFSSITGTAATPTFGVSEVLDTTTAPGARSFAVSTTAVAGYEQRAYVLMLTGAAPQDVYYARADFDDDAGTNGTFSSWTTGALDTSSFTFTNLQIVANGLYVMGAWAVNDGGSNQTIRYRYSSDRGVTWSSTIENVNNSLDYGYGPTNVNIVYQVSNDALVAWTDSSSRIRLGWSSNFASATPTWSTLLLGDSYATATAVHGGRYSDNWVIAYLGTSSLLDTEDSLYAFIGGGETSPPMTSTNQWAQIHIDSEEAVPGSLNVAMDQTGIYVTYGTIKTVLGTTVRQLKLAYCLQECAGAGNWKVSTLRYTSDDDASGLGEAYRGALMAIDSSTQAVYVGAARDPAGTDYYEVSRAGRISRK